METPEFPNNSKAAQKAKNEPAPEKKVEAVVAPGEAIRRKKPLGKRFREFFITSEDPRGVVEYLWQEHIANGIRDLIFDTAQAGLERKLYGDSGYRGGSNRRGRGNNNAANGWLSQLTDYGAYSSGPQGSPNKTPQGNGMSRQARRTLNFGEVLVPSRVIGEAVLSQMVEIVSQFDEVTVADFMQMTGNDADFMHEKYGWTDLRGARVVRAKGGGYTFSLPPTEELA